MPNLVSKLRDKQGRRSINSSTARQRLADWVGTPDAEYDRLSKDAGYADDGRSRYMYPKTITVEKATGGHVSAETLDVANFAAGEARNNAANRRIAELRADPAWLNEGDPRHQQVLDEMKLMYELKG